MGDMAESFVKRVATRIALVIAALAIFSIKSCLSGGGGMPAASSNFPAKVFGGGTPVTIEVELTDPGDINCTFASGNGYSVNNPKYERVDKKLPAGKHSFVVSVPKQTEVSPEVHIRPPHLKKGSKIVLQVKRGGEVIAKDEVESDSDKLAPNTAFFAQLEVNDAGG